MSKKDNSQLANDLVEAFQEMAADLRGDTVMTGYETERDVMTPTRIQAIRKIVATSTKEFERKFGVNARTMEAYEAGRRAPDAAMLFLLWSIEQEPESAMRIVARHTRHPEAA